MLVLSLKQKTKMKKYKTGFIVPALILFSFLLTSWGRTGHRVISLKSALSYNQEMKHFWDWTAYLTTHSSDADTRRVTLPNEAPYHYIDIDNYPEFKTNGKISQSYAEVVETHGEKFVLKQGILPWTTLAIIDSLTECFVKRDFEKATYFAADLGHFVADGHMPFHITGNYDGQFTGNKGIHGRYESGMINRFENEIHILGKSAVFIENPENFIFNYLYSNFRYVDSILIADNYSQDLAGNSSSELYTETLWKETGNYTEMFFEEASHAFSSLLYTAWINGGSPKIQKGKDFLLSETEQQIWQVSTNGFFKKSISIDYLAEVDSTLEILIYDRSGDRIEILVEKPKDSEPIHIEWAPISNKKAVYFIVLKSKKYYYVQKVAV